MASVSFDLYHLLLKYLRRPYIILLNITFWCIRFNSKYTFSCAVYCLGNLWVINFIRFKICVFHKTNSRRTAGDNGRLFITVNAHNRFHRLFFPCFFVMLMANALASSFKCYVIHSKKRDKWESVCLLLETWICARTKFL